VCAVVSERVVPSDEGVNLFWGRRSDDGAFGYRSRRYRVTRVRPLRTRRSWFVWI